MSQAVGQTVSLPVSVRPGRDKAARLSGPDRLPTPRPGALQKERVSFLLLVLNERKPQCRLGFCSTRRHA